MDYEEELEEFRFSCYFFKTSTSIKNSFCRRNCGHKSGRRVRESVEKLSGS